MKSPTSIRLTRSDLGPIHTPVTSTDNEKNKVVLFHIVIVKMYVDEI